MYKCQFLNTASMCPIQQCVRYLQNPSYIGTALTQKLKLKIPTSHFLFQSSKVNQNLFLLLIIHKLEAHTDKFSSWFLTGKMFVICQKIFFFPFWKKKKNPNKKNHPNKLSVAKYCSKVRSHKISLRYILLVLTHIGIKIQLWKWNMK